jgi:hypothetical protein
LRNHEFQGSDEVRRDLQQPLPFDQGLPHELELEMFQVPKAPVNELCAGRRRMRGKIVLLDQQNSQAPTGRVARDTATVYAAADNEQVERSGFPHVELDNATWN